MKRLFITLLVYLLTNGYQLKSQTSYSVDKWMEYLEQLALETDDEARIEALYADLSQLSEHRIGRAAASIAIPVGRADKQPPELPYPIR